MRNFVIFLYFVFLFKLAFAQSLPSIPGLDSDTIDSAKDAFGDFAEIPELDDGDSFPSEFDLPEMSGSDSGSTNSTDDPFAELEKLDEIDTPTLSGMGEINKVPAITSDSFETDMPTMASPTMEIDQFAPNDFSEESNIQTPQIDDGNFEGIGLDNFFAEEEFPETPDLDFKKKRVNQAKKNVEKALTPEEKERKVEEILGTIFVDEEPAIPQFNEEDFNSSESGNNNRGLVNMGDFDEDNKSRAKHKPITYSEDQLVEHLVKAAMNGDKEAVISLLHSGRSVNSKNKFGETPLMAAVYNSHNDIVEILLSEGAKPNIVDNNGNKPLHVASARTNFFAAQQLIRYGSEIDARNNANDTPLLIATLNNALDIIDLLIRHGADVNQANADGLTSLHVATYNNNPEIVKYLLYVGANANMINRDGLKPYDLAYGKNLQLARLLAAYTGPQRFVSTDLPRIINSRNQPAAPTVQVNKEDQFNIFPEAYSEQEALQEQNQRQKQHQWWGAVDKSTKALQPVKDNSVYNVDEPPFPSQIPAQPQQQAINSQPIITPRTPVPNYQQQPVANSGAVPVNNGIQEFAQSSLQQQILDLNEFEDDLNNYEGSSQAYTSPQPIYKNNSLEAPTQRPQSMARASGSNQATVTRVSSNSNPYRPQTARIQQPKPNHQDSFSGETFPVNPPAAYSNSTPQVGYNNSYNPPANNVSPRSLSYKDIARQRVNQAQFSDISYLSEVRTRKQPAESIIRNNISFMDPERPNTGAIKSRAIPLSQANYRTRSTNIQPRIQPKQQIQYQRNLQPAQRYNRNDLKTTNRPASISRANQYSNQPTVSVRPLQQRTSSQRINTKTANNASPQSRASSNGSRYSTLTSKDKAKWNQKLEKWVKAGLKIKSMSPKNKQLWKKQQAILQNVYGSNFRKSIAITKQRIILDNNRNTKNYGKDYQKKKILNRTTARASNILKPKSSKTAYSNRLYQISSSR